MVRVSLQVNFVFSLLTLFYSGFAAAAVFNASCSPSTSCGTKEGVNDVWMDGGKDDDDLVLL